MIEFSDLQFGLMLLVFFISSLAGVYLYERRKRRKARQKDTTNKAAMLINSVKSGARIGAVIQGNIIYWHITHTGNNGINLEHASKEAPVSVFPVEYARKLANTLTDEQFLAKKNDPNFKPYTFFAERIY